MALFGSSAASGLICILSQILHEREERRRLANKESHCSEDIDQSHGYSLGFRRPDDGARREFAAKEGAGLWHDQVGQKKSSPPKGEEFKSGDVTDTPVTGSTAVMYSLRAISATTV